MRKSMEPTIEATAPAPKRMRLKVELEIIKPGKSE